MCWITGGHTIHSPIKGLFSSTRIKPIPFQNLASKVAGLQILATKVPYFDNLSELQQYFDSLLYCSSLRIVSKSDHSLELFYCKRAFENNDSIDSILSALIWSFLCFISLSVGWGGGWRGGRKGAVRKLSIRCHNCVIEHPMIIVLD